jgi:hypothetical protein
LGLGDIEVYSALNQPLVAEIDLTSVRPGEVDDMVVELADEEAFSRSGLERPFHLTRLRFEVATKDDGSEYIKVTTDDPVREPFLNFLVDVDWPRGRLMREYTILLDPPVFATTEDTGEGVSELAPSSGQAPDSASAAGEPAMIERDETAAPGAGESGARRAVAATSGPDGTIVFPVPAGQTSGRITFLPRAQAGSLAGDPRMELIVRSGPLRWVDVRPEELLLSPDREASREVRVRLRDAYGNGLPAVMVLLVSGVPPAGSVLARGVTDSGGETRLPLMDERLRGVGRLGVWARDSLLTWVPVRTAGDEPDRAGGSAMSVHRRGGSRDGGQGREP